MQDYNKEGNTYDPNASFFDKIKYSFTKVFGTVKDKVKDVDWKENIEVVKEAGSKAYKVAKKAGNYMIEQSKPIMENIADKTKNIYNEIVKPEPRIEIKISDSDEFSNKAFPNINESFINEPFLEELQSLRM
jgi:hypothetical protein